MSKQDIEKRLGFAAQGVKAEMAIGSYKQGDRTVTVNGKKYEVLPYQMDFFIKELATLDTPEWRADVVKEYLRRGYIKSTSSRPGVKAKMGSSQVNDSATTADLIREAQRLRDVIKTSNREFDKTHLRQIKQELDKRGVLMPYGASEVLASRPGVKVKSARIDSSMLDGSMREVPIILKDGNHAVARKSASGWKVDGHADIPAFAKLRDLVAHMDKMGFSRPGAKAKMAAEIASDPRDKDFEKLKTLKGVVHQGKGFYIIPNKLMTPERRTKVKRSTQRYELSNMGDLVGWGTNHPNVNDYRLKDWAEAFA